MVNIITKVEYISLLALSKLYKFNITYFVDLVRIVEYNEWLEKPFRVTLVDS